MAHMNIDLKKLWVEVEVLLLKARGLFLNPESGEDGFSQERFLEYIDHNELGMALDELEGIPLYNETTKEFWELLLKAANHMKLKDKALEFEKAISSYA